MQILSGPLSAVGFKHRSAKGTCSLLRAEPEVLCTIDWWARGPLKEFSTKMAHNLCKRVILLMQGEKFEQVNKSRITLVQLCCVWTFWKLIVAVHAHTSQRLHYDIGSVNFYLF
jgi:hypothetical protein